MKLPLVRPPFLRLAQSRLRPSPVLWFLFRFPSWPPAVLILWSDRHLCTFSAGYFFPCVLFPLHLRLSEAPSTSLCVALCRLCFCTSSILVLLHQLSSSTAGHMFIYPVRGWFSISQHLSRNAIIRLQYPDAPLRSVIIRCSICWNPVYLSACFFPLGCLDFNTTLIKNQYNPCSKRIQNKNNKIHENLANAGSQTCPPDFRHV